MSRHWPHSALIYEINTWIWLSELNRNATRPLTLDAVPEKEWDRIAALGFDAVWLMGVWERSPAGRSIAMANSGLLADFRCALPDFKDEDNVGSPYCVRNYTVDAHLGGPAGLASARRKLAQRGMRLILDFVPNHVAPDHPWVDTHPAYFIQGTVQELAQDPQSFMACAGKVFACGRDPFFPAWPDVLQLNGFDAGLRRAAIETLTDIADQCDGVRCDMAMLLVNSIFERTWGARAGSKPAIDYWSQVIAAVKETHLGFQFIAEAYWDLEWELQQQGFDYCYDKRLYDRLEHQSAINIHMHLGADLGFQQKLVRFIENHDEPRAAAAFDSARHRAAAVTALTLPGARLIHEGQMAARQIRVPVFLARRPNEAPDLDMMTFYHRLLEAMQQGDFLGGTWRLCDRSGWPDNHSHLNLVSWCWQREHAFCLIIVNLSGAASQGLVRIPLDHLRGQMWRLEEVFSSKTYERSGDEMTESGLYVQLPPWGFHLFTSSYSPLA